MTTTEHAATARWTVDPVHSSATFSVKYLLTSTFTAAFKEIDATLEFHGDHLHLTGAVPVESLDIHEPSFRAHLLSPEFFDVERHPELLFHSTDLRRGDDGSLELLGELTIKGITRPITATGTIGETTSLSGHEVVGVVLQAVVDRHEFELNWNAPLPSGGLALADEVTLTVQLQLKRA